MGLSATLPLYFQRGYHTRQLSLSAGWNYSNGMVADLNKIEWENGSIHNIQRIGFNEGLHKLSFGAGFSDQVRLAHRDFAPRWGYALNASYTFDPANADFSNLVSFYGQSYLPGFAPHHSVLLAATYQTSVGGYKFPAGYAPLSYKSTRLIPHGFTSSEIVSNDYTALSLDYQLPVWYPEGGIGSVLYFKRIRLNAGGDYAQFPPPGGQRNGVAAPSGPWAAIWSSTSMRSDSPLRPPRPSNSPVTDLRPAACGLPVRWDFRSDFFRTFAQNSVLCHNRRSGASARRR